MTSSFISASSDEVQLEACTNEPSLSGTAPQGLAIIAHPYGYLGGSLSDHVVTTVARALSANGFRTVRFNSRGVGKSGGKGSWTGEVEGRDYEAVARASIKRFQGDFPSVSNAKLILAGYSAGSLYATAAQLAPAELPSVFDSTIRYLLISYPLDKLWALSLFSGARWKRRVAERAEHGELLVIHGTADQFTKVESYRKWSQEIMELRNVRFSVVDGADHFWAEEHHRDSLVATMLSWLRGGTTTGA